MGDTDVPRTRFGVPRTGCSRPMRMVGVTAMLTVLAIVATACGGSSSKNADSKDPTTLPAPDTGGSKDSAKRTSHGTNTTLKPGKGGKGSSSGKGGTGAKGGHRSGGTPTTADAKHPATTIYDPSDPEHEENTDPLPVHLYLFHGSALAVVNRNVTSANGVDALSALFDGPSAADKALGDRTAIPSGVFLNNLSLKGNTALVDVSAAFTGGAPSATVMRERIAQVVFTATQFAGTQNVAFAVDGTRQSPIAGVKVDPPLGRNDLTSVLDTVLTETPAPNTSVHSPLFVVGMSDAFEGAVSVRLVDSNGHVVAETSTDATAGSGSWGTFTARLGFGRPATSTGTLEVFDASEGDGTGPHGQRIPVRFG